VVRTYEKNAVCDGYTSSYSLRLFPSPQGEGLLNSALWGNKFLKTIFGKSKMRVL